MLACDERIPWDSRLNDLCKRCICSDPTQAEMKAFSSGGHELGEHQELRAMALELILRRNEPELAIKITKRVVGDQDANVRATFLTLIRKFLPKFYSS